MVLVVEIVARWYTTNIEKNLTNFVHAEQIGKIYHIPLLAKYWTSKFWFLVIILQWKLFATAVRTSS